MMICKAFAVLLVCVIAHGVLGKDRRENYCSVVKSGYRLSYALYHDFVSNGAGNLIFSPYSISSFTAMLMLGTGGMTQMELRAFLQYGDCRSVGKEIHESHRVVREYIEKTSSGVSFSVANRLFPGFAFNIRQNYTALAEYYYGISVQSLNFKQSPENARIAINNWAAEETNGLIKEVMPAGSIDSLTQVVLANAIYFKDTWKTQFDPRRNIDAEFYTGEKTSVTTTFMSAKGMYKHASNGMFSLIELPYNGDVACMIILLPKRVDGLAHLESMFGGGELYALNRYGIMREVVVRIPKFKIDFETELKETYENLGVEELFGNADFSPMTESNGMFISTIRHKAFIEVNEKGTEAAAVTAGAATRSLNFQATFICDRPFMFYIVHKATKSILFLGRYVSPS